METLEQDEVIERLKLDRESWPVPLNESIICYDDGKFLVSATAPAEAELPLVLLGACIPGVFADEAIYVLDGHARSKDADQSVPISEDPTACSALVVVFSDREGLLEWRLVPYGTTDGGKLEWADPWGLTTPEVDDVCILLSEVYALGDLRSECNDLLFRLTANDYKVVAHTRILEEG